MPNKNNHTTNNNNRGRFLLGRAAPSLRRPQKKSGKSSRGGFLRKSNADRISPQLSPLREHVVSRPGISSTATTSAGFRPRKPQQPTVYYSKSPIVTQENVDATGFSKAELFDLEESFKLFDVYGEGNVQVGDLKGILEVLQQEQQDESTSGPKYPHLETLMDRLSELSDEDTLDIDDYIRLMASTTISNAIAMEGGGVHTDSTDEHFARVFRLFDTENKGYITLEDLKRIAIELGEHDMTKGELQEMIDRAVGGHSHDGSEQRVGINEFTRMMTMSLFPALLDADDE